jgi:hypothetical protein
MQCSSTLFSRFPKQLLLNLVRKSGKLFTLHRDLHLETPDGEVSASIFFLIGSCPGKDREFGHTSHLHSSRYKSTGLNHRVGRDLSIYPASLASFLFFFQSTAAGPVLFDSLSSARCYSFAANVFFVFDAMPKLHHHSEASISQCNY